MKVFLLILLGAIYIGNSIVLSWLFPKASEDYYQFIAFVEERNKIYEFMFTGFFLVSFLDSKRLPKSISCFFMILTCGSFIDKTIFNITHYLLSDIILAIVAFLISFYVYVREQ